MVFLLIIISISVLFIAFVVYINSFEYKYKNIISKIFVINMIKRTERLALFSSTYNLEQSFEIFNAVDGKSLDIPSLIKSNVIGNYGALSLNKERNHHFQLTNEGSIGCYLSHHNLWKQLSQLNDDNFLIFEDDTIFNKISLKEINYRLSKIPKDWDIFLLSNPNSCYSKDKINRKLFKVKRFFLLNAYIINKKAITKIFNTNTIFPINQQLDSYLSELATDYNLNIYVNSSNFRYYQQSNDFTTDIQETYKLNKELSFDRLKIK